MILPRYLQSHCALGSDIDGFTPELEFRIDRSVEGDTVYGALCLEVGVKCADRGMVDDLLENYPETQVTPSEINLLTVHIHDGKLS